jgi:cobalt-zinc-cadmium efflux system protein
MGWGHNHTDGAADSTRDIGIAFFLNLIFAVAEFIGAFLTNSLALFSNALHDVGDSLILGWSYFMERSAGKSPTKRFSYGYRRISLLSALANSLLLIIGSAYIISEAIPRILHPQEADAVGMMYFAIAGVLVNGYAMLRLRRGKSMNARVVTWHILEDVLGWAAILVASIVMQIVYLPVLDAILSLLIAAYILYYNVWYNLSRTIRLFMQAAPEDVDVAQLTERMQRVDGVLAVHDTHVWSLDGARHVLSAHVVVRGDSDRETLVGIKSGLKAMLRGEGMEHVTLEIEYDDEQCDPCRQSSTTVHKET